MGDIKTCKKGHPMTPENSKPRAGGKFSCRTCIRERRRAYYEIWYKKPVNEGIE